MWGKKQKEKYEQNLLYKFEAFVWDFDENGGFSGMGMFGSEKRKQPILIPKCVFFQFYWIWCEDEKKATKNFWTDSFSTSVTLAIYKLSNVNKTVVMENNHIKNRKIIKTISSSFSCSNHQNTDKSNTTKNSTSQSPLWHGIFKLEDDKKFTHVFTEIK